MRSRSPPPSIPIRILTHNIRYATASPFPGELPWPERKAGLISELLYHTRHCATSLICLQEVLHSQLLDILEDLNVPAGPHAPLPEGQWSYLGVGRDDGKTAGEFSPIIYRRDVWRVDQWFTMWLSPTPWAPGSKGWDAASVRILTVAKLEHRATGQKVLATNTHLDDQGSVSRRESAKLVVRTIRHVLAEEDVEGGFLAGDLNSEVCGEVYPVLNEVGSGLVDLQRLVAGGYGDEMTFTGYVMAHFLVVWCVLLMRRCRFDGRGDGEGRAMKIDFIHLSTSTAPKRDQSAKGICPRESNRDVRAPWAVQGYAVLPNRFEDGVYISDHRAVVGDVLLLPRP
jgi:endonuclease/exonuclease/phosphatase family metal-dependent hydrolase